MTPAGDAKLTVAITGPTGDIGRALVRALERSRTVGEIRGMARRPIDPEYGFKRLKYVQGDVLDRDAVESFVAGADVVVHLAFIILGSHDETLSINLEGSRNVFEAAIGCGAKRLVYASSVAAYGFHDDNPIPLTEDIPPRGTDDFYYSAQKAELESVLEDFTRGVDIESYIFRPCIVSGPDAPLLIDNIPYVRISDALPGAVRRLFDVVPILKPVIPDNGVPFQLVHHDDVATAMRDRRSRARASRGSTTWPGRASSACPISPTRWATTRCRCPTWRWTRPPSWLHGCRSCRPRPPGSTRCACPS